MRFQYTLLSNIPDYFFIKLIGPTEKWVAKSTSILKYFNNVFIHKYISTTCSISMTQQLKKSRPWICERERGTWHMWLVGGKKRKGKQCNYTIITKNRTVCVVIIIIAIITVCMHVGIMCMCGIREGLCVFSFLRLPLPGF